MISFLCSAIGAALCALGALYCFAIWQQIGAPQQLPKGQDLMVAATLMSPGLGLFVSGVIFLAFGRIIDLLVAIRDKLK